MRNTVIAILLTLLTACRPATIATAVPSTPSSTPIHTLSSAVAPTDTPAPISVPSPTAIPSPTPPSSSFSDLTLSLGDSRPLAPDFLGLNAETVNPAADERMLAALKGMQVSNLRYPGGGTANYWDWELGWLYQNLDENKLIWWMAGMPAQPYRFTLQDLARVHQETGVTPVFVLNMITSALDEQLKVLQQAADLGLPIARIELGNELYLDIEPYVLERYPTVEDYAADANRWAAAIKAAFPNVKVAVVGAASTGRATNPRTGGWDKALFPLLSTDIDAVTEHLYIDFGVGAPVQPGTGWGSDAEQVAQYRAMQTPQGIQKMLSRPFLAWHEMNRFSHLPTDRQIWMTEFSIFDWNGPARGTWAHGLTTAGFLHTFLENEQVDLVCYHSLAGGPLFAAVFPSEDHWAGLSVAEIRTPAYEPTAVGRVLALFGEAMTGMDTATRLDFSPQPTVTVGLMTHPTTFGWRFSNGAERRLILVNLSEQPYTADIAALDAPGLSYRQVYAVPWAWVTDESTLAQVEGTAGNVIILPAFSITLIRE